MSEVRAIVQHLVIATDGDMVGTSVGILEAQAAGVLVVSTRHAGIPDVVQHEKTGLLVDENDIKGMAIGMLSLLDDRPLAIIFWKSRSGAHQKAFFNGAAYCQVGSSHSRGC